MPKRVVFPFNLGVGGNVGLLLMDERTDAAIIANFELGKLAMRTAEAPDIGRLVKGLKTPEEYFRIVIAAPENPYQQKAAELLASLQPAVGGK
mgnify:CR=1 FL=1